VKTSVINLLCFAILVYMPVRPRPCVKVDATVIKNSNKLWLLGLLNFV